MLFTPNESNYYVLSGLYLLAAAHHPVKDFAVTGCTDGDLRFWNLQNSGRWRIATAKGVPDGGERGCDCKQGSSREIQA